MHTNRHQQPGPETDPLLRARHDAVLAFQLDAMFSRRPHNPISLPRPPLTRGR